MKTLLIGLFVLFCNQLWAQSVCQQSAHCQGRFYLNSSRYLPVLQSHPTQHTRAQNQIRRAVIVIHGTTRNPTWHFDSMIEGARIEQKLNETLVLAPHFKKTRSKKAEVAWYRENAWRSGDKSTLNSYRISSFSVMDKIFERLADKRYFPNLHTIVLIGHSAGGQFSQRYAVGARAPNRIRSDLRVKYVVANPSSYMYLNKMRWNESSRKFYEPRTWCRYNTYKYGMRKRNNYMDYYSKRELQNQYQDREVYYYLGTADVEKKYLDESCAANYQGKNRYDRGLKYLLHLLRYFPQSDHRIRFANGMGHDTVGMYLHPVGRRIVFL